MFLSTPPPTMCIQTLLDKKGVAGSSKWKQPCANSRRIKQDGSTSLITRIPTEPTEHTRWTQNWSLLLKLDQRQADLCLWVGGQPGPQSEFQHSQNCYTRKPCLKTFTKQQTNVPQAFVCWAVVAHTFNTITWKAGAVCSRSTIASKATEKSRKKEKLTRPLRWSVSFPPPP